MHRAHFRRKFEEVLRTAGEVLEENGYDVQNYKAFVRDQNENHYFNFADNPQEALDQTLEETRNGEKLAISVNSDEIYDVVNNELDAAKLIYRNVCGGIDLDEPTTQPEWAEEPVLAFGTQIHYRPEFPEDYFEVGTLETQPPYTREDAEERVEDIVNVLEGKGFSAEKGFID